VTSVVPSNHTASERRFVTNICNHDASAYDAVMADDGHASEVPLQVHRAIGVASQVAKNALCRVKLQSKWSTRAAASGSAGVR